MNCVHLLVCVCVCVCVITVTVHETHNTEFFTTKVLSFLKIATHRDTTQQLINALGSRGYFTCPPGLTFSNSAFCPKRCIYVNCMDLRTNSDYFPIQR